MRDLFEAMIEAVVSGGMSESSVVDHYYLVHYPYTQGSPETRADGEAARADLLRRFSQPPVGRDVPPPSLREVAPPGWEGTVKAMKRKRRISNPWALSWWMKSRGYSSHKRGRRK